MRDIPVLYGVIPYYNEANTLPVTAPLFLNKINLVQDGLNAMNEMVEKYLEGFDVVYEMRNDCSSDTFFKRFTAEAFYKLLRAMGAEVVFNHSDYRLSIKSIRIISSIGIAVSGFNFLLFIRTIVRFFQHQTVPGLASTCDSICLMGGLQLICMGAIGKYTGKIYMETKERPRYIIGKHTANMEEERHALDKKE